LCNKGRNVGAKKIVGAGLLQKDAENPQIEESNQRNTQIGETKRI